MEPTALPTFQNLPTHLREPFLRAVQANLSNGSFLLIPMVDSVTSFAIDKLRSEWKVTDTAIANQDTLEPCDCEILLQYSLPYKHFLLEVAQGGSPIPRSLLHPRWWLNGPVIRRGPRANEAGSRSI